ncbi:iron response transcriptional regulator IrrA [Pseudemcibacter aquimaris]|uniref:iron response transcriptional regulator IrrA n=1 Tax=Pseudemcibacter aquimaris TaxID=2857064 RepID=UPI0020137484|nr:Fur family transcriptional regulator [Pseudemcibacter aquimaris]MCC3861888.1 transcriptional repressor [Pseudemcibacter aquimaris]WDU58641.1 transcriptional repressor [Pseudemcibacter aquimaris]
MDRPYSKALKCLQGAGLRPTRQRLALAKLLFDGDNRHVTAEVLHNEVNGTGAKVSLATIYNTLHQFTEAGLLKEVIVDSNCTYFDTNTSDHHHLYFAQDEHLHDLSSDELIISKLPNIPSGKKISAVNVVVHVEDQ